MITDRFSVIYQLKFEFKNSRQNSLFIVKSLLKSNLKYFLFWHKKLNSDLISMDYDILAARDNAILILFMLDLPERVSPHLQMG